MYTVHLEALLEMAEILPHEAGLFSFGELYSTYPSRGAFGRRGSDAV